MKYYGDIALGKTLTFLFTATDSTGLATDITTTPVVSVYKDAGTTEFTTGASIAKFDDRAGVYLVTIDTASGYTAGSDYTIVITSESTIGTILIKGYIVGSFSIQNRTGSYSNPSMIVDVEADTMDKMIVQLWSRFFKKVVKNKTTSEILVMADDGSILTMQNYAENTTGTGLISGDTIDYVDNIASGSNK